jgi:hypothetical protein
MLTNKIDIIPGNTTGAFQTYTNYKSSLNINDIASIN